MGVCLAKIGHLDLLKYFFDEIIVPEAVYNEIRDTHEPHDALCKEFVFGHILS